MLVMRGMTLLGGHRDSIAAYSPVACELLTGTALRMLNTANDEPAGPKGQNSGTSLSAPKIDVPSAACVVTTTRGFESAEGMAQVAAVVGTAVVEVLEDILEARREVSWA
jgi:hypothetical protein